MKGDGIAGVTEGRVHNDVELEFRRYWLRGGMIRAQYSSYRLDIQG